MRERVCETKTEARDQRQETGDRRQKTEDGRQKPEETDATTYLAYRNRRGRGDELGAIPGDVHNCHEDGKVVVHLPDGVNRRGALDHIPPGALHAGDDEGDDAGAREEQGGSVEAPVRATFPAHRVHRVRRDVIPRRLRYVGREHALELGRRRWVALAHEAVRPGAAELVQGAVAVAPPREEEGANQGVEAVGVVGGDGGCGGGGRGGVGGGRAVGVGRGLRRPRRRSGDGPIHKGEKRLGDAVVLSEDVQEASVLEDGVFRPWAFGTRRAALADGLALLAEGEERGDRVWDVEAVEGGGVGVGGRHCARIRAWLVSRPCGSC